MVMLKLTYDLAVEIYDSEIQAVNYKQKLQGDFLLIILFNIHSCY